MTGFLWKCSSHSPIHNDLQNVPLIIALCESLIYDENSGRLMLVLKIRIENEEWIYEEWTDEI